MSNDIPLKYNDADAVILYEGEVLDVLSLDESYLEYTLVKKIQKHDQKKDETFVFSDNPRSQIVDIVATAKYPDGTKRIRSFENIPSVPDISAEELYSDRRSRIVTFADIKNGTVIEIKLRRKFSNPMLWNSILFQGELPILHKHFNAIFPTSLDPLLDAVAMDAEPDTIIITADSRQSLIWDKYDIDAFKPEAGMPGWISYLSSLRVSVDSVMDYGVKIDPSSWAGISKWYYDLTDEKLKKGAYTTQLLEKMEISQTSTEGVIAKDIYNYIKTHLRYVSIPLDMGDVEPNSAERVLENRFGDCKDQAAALVAALREAGVSSYLVLVRTTDIGNLNNPFPFPRYFNHAIACAEINGNDVFMDPTCSSCGFGELPYIVQGAHALVIRPGEESLINLPCGFLHMNLESISSRIHIIDNGKAQISDTLRYDGYFAAGYRHVFSKNRDNQTEDIISEILFQNRPEVIIDKIVTNGIYEDNQTCELIIHYSIPNFYYEGAAALISPLFYSMHANLLPTMHRSYPYELGPVFRKDYRLRISSDKNISLVNIPKSVAFTTEYFHYAGLWQNGPEEIKFSRRYETLKSMINADDYQDFYNYQLSITDFEEKKIVIETVGSKE